MRARLPAAAVQLRQALLINVVFSIYLPFRRISDRTA